MTATESKTKAKSLLEIVVENGYIDPLVTVQGRKAYNALPNGTELIDTKDSEPWKKDDAGIARTSAGDTIHDVKDYMPAIVTNPEILGEFKPKDDDKFKAGDKVELVHSAATSHMDGWYGLTGEVVENKSGIVERDGWSGRQVFIKPDTNRPDGGRDSFWWAVEGAEIHVPKRVFAVGDRVETIGDDRLASGKLGTVRTARIGFDGRFVVGVNFDDAGNYASAYYETRFKATTKLQPMRFEVGQRVEAREASSLWPVGTLGTVTKAWRSTGFNTEFVQVAFDDGRCAGEDFFATRFDATTKQKPFVIGQRVELLHDAYGIKAGSLGEVTMLASGDGVVRVAFDDSPFDPRNLASRRLVATTKPKLLTVGQRVELLADAYDRKAGELGEVVVAQRRGGSGSNVTVVFDDQPERKRFFYASRFKVTMEPKPEPVFVRGQRVELIEAVVGLKVGQAGEVVRETDWDGVLRVIFDHSPGRERSFYPRRFKASNKPKPEVGLKVGQRVEVVDGVGTGGIEKRLTVGELGTITKLGNRSDGKGLSLVHFAADSGAAVNTYWAKRFKVTDKPAPVKAGDQLTTIEQVLALPVGSFVTRDFDSSSGAVRYDSSLRRINQLDGSAYDVLSSYRDHLKNGGLMTVHFVGGS